MFPPESQSANLRAKALSFELFKMLSNKLNMTDPMPSLRGAVEKRATQSEIHETRATVDMEFAAPEMHLINLPATNLSKTVTRDHERHTQASRINLCYI